MNRFNALVATSVSIVAAASLICVSAMGQSPQGAEVIPNEKMQEKFRELASLLVDRDLSTWKTEGVVRYGKLVSELSEEARGNKVYLLRQWFYCYSYWVSAQEGERRSNLAISMQGLWQNFDIAPEDVAYGFYPLLDSEDPELLDILEPFVDRGLPEDATNFGVYEKILQEEYTKNGDIPLGLARYMYDRMPGIALLTMMTLDAGTFGELKAALKIVRGEESWTRLKNKSLTLVEGQTLSVISNELENLSRRPEWWIQLFVAEFVAQIPDVNNDEIRLNLRKAKTN
jgi:hypothetical protein